MSDSIKKLGIDRLRSPQGTTIHFEGASRLVNPVITDLHTGGRFETLGISIQRDQHQISLHGISNRLMQLRGHIGIPRKRECLEALRDELNLLIEELEE